MWEKWRPQGSFLILPEMPVTPPPAPRTSCVQGTYRSTLSLSQVSGALSQHCFCSTREVVGSKNSGDVCRGIIPDSSVKYHDSVRSSLTMYLLGAALDVWVHRCK